MRLREFNIAIRYSDFLFDSLYDFTIHTSGPNVDPVEVSRELMPIIRGFPMPPGTFRPASFDHPMDGYDSLYHSYPLDDILGSDLLRPFELGGPLNEKTGRRLRTEILEQGGLRPSRELFERFLGRPAGYETFFRRFGFGEPQRLTVPLRVVIQELNAKDKNRDKKNKLVSQEVAKTFIQIIEESRETTGRSIPFKEAFTLATEQLNIKDLIFSEPLASDFALAIGRNYHNREFTVSGVADLLARRLNRSFIVP